MYITIDKTNLRFINKHPSFAVLINISIIETPHLDVHILPCNYENFLYDYTDYELKMLYENTFLRPQICFNKDLRTVLMKFAQNMPVLNCDAREVDLQAEHLGPENQGKYKYVKNSTLPAKVKDYTDIFYHTIATIEPSEWDDKLIARLGMLHVMSLFGEDLPIPLNTKMALPPKQVSTPRAVNSKNIIFVVAEDMWVDAGKPIDLPSLLKLRKQIMDRLEKDCGVKKTTSSSQLGNWQKTKLK